MSIAWRDAMSVGDAAIDADHRHLIGLVNSFKAAVAAEIDHKRAARVLLALMDYTTEHFAREEALQKEVRYNAFAALGRAPNRRDTITIKLNTFAKTAFQNLIPLDVRSDSEGIERNRWRGIGA
ncbi:bacteriohemerythrin [Magnetospirillum moscoviense]|nr:hemerythrin domain-containing protein [Magnetospirillum moscoviense]